MGIAVRAASGCCALRGRIRPAWLGCHPISAGEATSRKGDVRNQLRTSRARRDAAFRSAAEKGRASHFRTTPGAKVSRVGCNSAVMEFSPAVDRRLRASIGLTVDLRSSADVWRRLRRRAQRLGTTTPCYESVRRLVIAERERRAELVAALGTVLEVAMRRKPTFPHDVSRIYHRRLVASRRVLELPSRWPP